MPSLETAYSSRITPIWESRPVLRRSPDGAPGDGLRLRGASAPWPIPLGKSCRSRQAEYSFQTFQSSFLGLGKTDFRPPGLRNGKGSVGTTKGKWLIVSLGTS